METKVEDGIFTDVRKEKDMRQTLREIMTSIEKELPSPGEPIPDYYIESKILIKLATRGYKIVPVRFM